jgi:serine phosphatase RsbU (regulator of sigma subunit)
MTHAWTNKKLKLAEGTIVVSTTDGVIDQIGGPKHIAFGKRRLREAMLASRALPMGDFAAALMSAHGEYQAGHSRRDDLTLYCFRA